MQIFVDPTGKRSGRVNVILGISFILTSLFIVFISVHTKRLHAVQRTAQSPTTQNESIRSSKASIFYTDNHEQAYSVLKDQIEYIDSIIIPSYLMSNSEPVMRHEYKELHDDVDFISLVKSLKTKRYHHMSNIDYTMLPLDRYSDPRPAKTPPTLFNTSQLLTIRESLIAADAKGLIIEIDESTIEDPILFDKMTEWFKSVKKLLNEKDLELGVHLSTNTYLSKSTPITSISDLTYISFLQKESITSQINEVLNIRNGLPKQTILELPTVSSEVNLTNKNAYVKNIAYSSVAARLLAQTLYNRSIEATEVTNDNKLNRIFDSVSAYNLVQKINNQSMTETIRYSIGSPGYEEYTLWALVTGPSAPKEQQQIISKKIMSDRGIELNGEGKVYNLNNPGSYGNRILLIDDKNNMVTESKLQSVNIPAQISKLGQKTKTAALTFDDGPHPIYTRKVMDVLEEHGVKGTFFVVGEKVSRYPDVAREIVQRGHQIENHTYTHAAISQLDKEAAIAEIKSTSEIIKLITGQQTQYFRRPYSGSDTFNTWGDVEYLQILKNLGLQASEYDVDTKDWKLGSAEEILQKTKSDIAEKPQGGFSQILLHDSHHNPDVTLQALPLIIKYLQNEEVSLVRVNELTNLDSNDAKLSTTFAAITYRDIFIQGLIIMNIGIIGFSTTKYIWMIIGSAVYVINRTRNRKKRPKHKTRNNYKPTLAIIIACYNEEKVIGKTIDSLLGSSYKKFRIIIVDDGSTDNTAIIVKNYANIDSRIELIQTPNQGKAKALNVGSSRVKNHWLVFCDADTLFKRNALENYVMTLKQSVNVGAIAGRIKVGNDINSLTRAQVIEYGVANYFTKPAQDTLNIITVVPGACGLWHRKSLIAAGSFSSDTLAEDADSTMNIVSLRKRVYYENNVIAATEAPHTISSLYKQRTRWQLGNMQALFKHHKGLFNSQYGTLGFIGLPMFYIEMLHVLFFPMLLLFTSSVLLVSFFGIDTAFPQSADLLSSSNFIWMSVGVIVCDIILSLLVIIRENVTRKQKLQLLTSLPYYYMFYRFFLSFSTLVALLRALRGRIHGWGHLQRSATVELKDVRIT
jgi:peptidoglycan-N-acetylglucosamine deacetylase